MVEQSNNKAARARRRRRGMLIGVLAIVIGSVGLPFTGTLLTGTSVAQEASQQANPRADTWREARKGMQGITTVQGQETDVLIQSGGQVWREVREGPISTYSMWAALAIIVVLAAYHLMTGGYKMGERTGRKILRWPGFDRFIHWYTAATFIVLAITGLSLLWGRDLLIPLMGKEAFAAYANVAKPIHDYLSLFFTAGLVVMLVKWMHHNIPKGYDLEWLLKGGGYLGGSHPPAGFANAGEKALYWTLVFAGGAMVVSGFFLLFPNLGTERAGMQLANTVHGISSVICCLFIILHIYLATIGSEGALEGMITGEVDEQYAKNHHPLWYEEIKKGGPSYSGGGAAAPAPAAPEK